MLALKMVRIVLCFCCFLVLAQEVVAQCQTIDFENYPVGTEITSQYSDVFFAVAVQTCGNDPPLDMRIADEFYTDLFGSRVLLIDTGCPDFSNDYLQMTFAKSQNNVQFLLGPWAGTYEVRVYAGVSGGTPLETHTIVIPGSGFVGVQHLVQLERAANEIRRVEVEAAASGHEAIDNLLFGMDDTPPVVEITYPFMMDCVTGTVTLSGFACDDDGTYDRDRLEYMKVYPDPQSEWTYVHGFVGSPVCNEGSLYYWDTSAPEITQGIYVLRVTSINDCGMIATDEITLNVDKGVDTLKLRSPLDGAVRGGIICFDGTIWDRLCFDHYTVKYNPPSTILWLPVDPAHPQYDATVTNEPFAWWDTTGLDDGEYDIQIHAETSTGIGTNGALTIEVDNTPPVALFSEPTGCASLSGEVKIRGTAYDANLDHWDLEYYDPATGDWQPLDVGNTYPITNGTLFEWDTTGIPPCYYTIRLRVWDTSVVNPCGGADVHRTDALVTVSVGIPTADLDGDGDVDLEDYALFQGAFTGPML